jgi:RND family efflux transporter MFP subunit
MPPRLLTPTSILLCSSLAFSLTGCTKDEVPVAASTPSKIELIQADLVPIEYGEVANKAHFSGTIRAVNQSSVQAQFSASALQVGADVGQRVNRGQVLVVLNNQDNAARLAQTQANLAATQAQANQARLMAERKKRLLDQGFISRVEYEQSLVDYQAQQENVAAQRANVDIANKANQDGVIKSPISGVITKRQVEPGQTVAAGQTLFEIVDPEHLELQAQIPTDQQAALTVGNQIEYRIQGNPASFTAKLSRIAPLADLNSRQIEFFARPEQNIPSLSIGAFIEGDIVFGETVTGQRIPLDVIQDLDGKAYVWVIRQQKIAKVYLNILEHNYSLNQAIVSGLDGNDQISRVSFNDKQLNQAVHISQ